MASRSIGQLQQTPDVELMRRYGDTGARLAKLARGEDARSVSTDDRMKSVSSETTFNTDLKGYDELSTELLAMSERLSERLKAKRPRRRHGDPQAQIRRISLANPRAGPDDPDTACQRALRNRPAAARPQRWMALLSVSSESVSAAFRRPMGSTRSTSSSPSIARRAAAERAIDRVRDRFGRDAVIRGKLYDRVKARAERNSDKTDEENQDDQPPR